jgi:hypothetical protein
MLPLHKTREAFAKNDRGAGQVQMASFMRYASFWREPCLARGGKILGLNRNFETLLKPSFTSKAGRRPSLLSCACC